MIAIIIIKSIPLIISTIFKHYTYGPPQPSWGLKLHLIVKLARFLAKNQNLTLEEVQEHHLTRINRIPPGFKIDKVIINDEFRKSAQTYIETLLKPYEIVIDPIWKSPKNKGINGEFLMDKNWDFNNVKNDWENEKIILYLHGGAYAAGTINIFREFCSQISKASGARTLAIDYRLAPQQPFPAALCDVLATYLYLTNPPKDSGFQPYKPEQIVICGDSSGGGLSVSLGLVLRDLGLPLPAGIVGLSSWFDLTHSMPSFFDPNMDETDALPPILGFKMVANPNSFAYSEFKSRTGLIINNIQEHPEVKLIGDDSLKRIGQAICYYVVNEGFGIPYVSPMLAESLGGLPPMLIVTGNAERLRDEAIYLSYRAANPERYRLPAYENDFDNSRFKSPTSVKLEVFDEMPHTFQLFPLEQSKLSIQRVGEFISNVIQEAIQAKPCPHKFEALKISYHGEVQNLDESSIEHVLKWDKAGVYPGV
ncbi:Alpha/Beta hydrolase protein [Glomus cerebriforme]|uniref:Alpha/Beta hydrolase protein n=1 Tax=Glomus cerebriforme TaxID=658196 RepID=A0A397TFH8_9GLOM|nr:Alpha/Beta hydrolase protein [Glomus cerebriforme]